MSDASVKVDNGGGPDVLGGKTNLEIKERERESKDEDLRDMVRDESDRANK